MPREGGLAADLAEGWAWKWLWGFDTLMKSWKMAKELFSVFGFIVWSLLGESTSKEAGFRGKQAAPEL